MVRKGQEIDGGVSGQHLDVAVLAQGPQQCAHDRPAGHVAHMQNSLARVRPFQAVDPIARGILVELDTAAIDQDLPQQSRPIFREELHGRPATKTGPRREHVLHE